MACEYFEGEVDVSDMKFTEMQQMFYKTLVEDECQHINKLSELPPPPPPKEDAAAAIAQQLQKDNHLLVDQLR